MSDVYRLAELAEQKRRQREYKAKVELRRARLEAKRCEELRLRPQQRVGGSTRMRISIDGRLVRV